MGGAGMFGDIGQGLLKHPVKTGLHGFAQRVVFSAQPLEFRDNLRAFLEFFGQRFQGGFQAQIVENGRAQGDGHVPNRLQGLVQMLEGVGMIFLGILVRQLKRAQFQAGQRKELPEMIVQRRTEAFALFFLDVEQAQGQLAALLLDAFAFAEIANVEQHRGFAVVLDLRGSDFHGQGLVAVNQARARVIGALAGEPQGIFVRHFLPYVFRYQIQHVASDELASRHLVHPAGGGIEIEDDAGLVFDKDGVGRFLEEHAEALLALLERLLGAVAHQGAANAGRHHGEQRRFAPRPDPLGFAILETDNAPEPVVDQDRHEQERFDAPFEHAFAHGGRSIGAGAGDGFPCPKKWIPIVVAEFLTRNVSKFAFLRFFRRGIPHPFKALAQHGDAGGLVGMMLHHVYAVGSGRFPQKGQCVIDGLAVGGGRQQSRRSAGDALQEAVMQMQFLFRLMQPKRVADGAGKAVGGNPIFGNIIVGAGFQQLDGQKFAAESCGDDGGHIQSFMPDLLEKIQAGAVRQQMVNDENVEGFFSEPVQRLREIRHFLNLSV